MPFPENKRVLKQLKQPHRTSPKVEYFSTGYFEFIEEAKPMPTKGAHRTFLKALVCYMYLDMAL